MKSIFLTSLLLLLASPILAGTQQPDTTEYLPLVYEGGEGIGKGKHIVLIANDHEYRSEQTCPALARILAKHYGFRCTVVFGLAEDGTIRGGATNTPGMESLKDADILFFFTRFMNLSDEQAGLLVDYFERGGPVVGVRTSTHCFNGQKGQWAKLNYDYNGTDYRGGLGEQVFGNTWHKERGQSHYGQNHVRGCRITPVASASGHPILRGVERIHAYSGAYESKLPVDATPLLEVQVLKTFDASDEILEESPIVNAGWTRDSYVAPSGAKKDARVVYTSFGASEDLLSEDARRFLVNACLWAGGLEDKITADMDVSVVGGFKPSPYTNGAFYFEGVTPRDLVGWDSQIMPVDAVMAGVKDPKGADKRANVLANRPMWRAELERAAAGPKGVREVDPAQSEWHQKYKNQQNAPKPEDMLLNTDAEPALKNGFKPLFNGQDLSGWTPRGGTCRFEVKDNLLIGTCVPGSNSTYLCTDRNDYADFIFTCDMKWEVDGNSGVMFRAQTRSEKTTEVVFGPQAEMEGITGDRFWNGGIYGQSCGGYFYPLWLKEHQAAREALRRTDWNRLTVMAKGNTVKTWVNGIPAAHWVDDGTYPRGFFGLQIHKGEKGTVLWRDIRVKELE